MPKKKDKRKKKITLLKQKQKQTQSQKVVINLADLVKKRPRDKPLVEPKKKEPNEMILTRIIREPAFTPPYQHHIPEPVKVSSVGLAQPQYIPETYKPVRNRELLEKMGQQPTPFHRSQDIEVAEAVIPIAPSPTIQLGEAEIITRKERRKSTDPTLIAEKAEKAEKARIKAISQELKEALKKEPVKSMPKDWDK